MQKLVTVFIFFLCPYLSFSQPTTTTPINLGVGDTLFSIAKLTSFIDDKTWQLGLKDVQNEANFTPMSQDLFKIGGNKPHNLWVKFQLQKETNKDIYLELSTGITDTLYLYAIHPNGKITTQRLGKYFPFSERLIKNNLQVFLVDCGKDELTTYYLNLRSQFPVSIRMRVGTSSAFIEEFHGIDLLHGIFIGIVLIVALFNLFFFIKLRDVFYGCYFVYAILMMCIVLRFDGYLFQYLHPQQPEFNLYGFYFHGLAGVFGIYFSRSFLQTKKYTPLLDKGLIFFLILYILNIGLAAVGLYELNILSIYFVTFSFNLFSIFTGIQVYRKGYSMARFFAAGVVCLTIGVTVFTLYNMGWLESNIWTRNSIYLALSSEAILFFTAIVERFSVLKQEKNDAQEKMIISLKQNESLMKEKNRLLEENAHNRSLELELMQSQLSEYAQKLFKSNEELTDFAHIASHDLRAPIRNIGSFTQLLERRISPQLDARSQEYLEFIKTNVRQSTKLIEDLLNYSKIDKNIGEAQPVDLNDVLYLVNNNLQSFITEKKANIIAKDLPILNGHTSLFVQLFQNLINNGLKYNQSETPTVTVSTEKQNNDLIFKIADNGIGISPQYKEQIFSMFRRLHSAAEYEGSGIGLAFCQRIVATYGGRIWFESIEGQGTTFIFTLPVAIVKMNAKQLKNLTITPVNSNSLKESSPQLTEGGNQKDENLFNNHARSKPFTYPSTAQPILNEINNRREADNRIISEFNLAPNSENAARFTTYDVEKLLRKTTEARFFDKKPPPAF